MSVKINITNSEEQLSALPLGVSTEKLAKWKHQFGEVVFVRVKGFNKDAGDGDKELGGYFKSPSLDVIKLVQNTAKKHGDIDAMEQLYINCKLEVSAEIERSTKLKLSVFAQLGTLLESYETEVLKF